MSIIKERIKILRSKMNEYGISACILPTSDPHLSEYVAPAFKYREYFSGFDGSAGTLFVTDSKAYLITDGRYFLQAENQLLNTDIELVKAGVEGQPDLFNLCQNNLISGNTVFADPEFFPWKQFSSIKEKLSENGINLVYDKSPISAVCDLPNQSFNPIYELDINISGMNRSDKLSKVRENMSANGADGLILSTLEDVAWLYNLRGSDVENTPVFYAYSYITQENAYLFVDSSAISDVIQSLASDCIKVLDYRDFYTFISKISQNKLIADENLVNARIISSLPESAKIVSKNNPVYTIKSVKNITEIENIRKTHIYDGIALLKFMRYIKSHARNFESEISASDKLYELRKNCEKFIGNSFETISAYAENAAIVHYAPTMETNKRIEPFGALLVDSGGQYIGGTTDVTRMFILGEVSDDFKRDYTLVCKAMLKLQNMQFPYGTKAAVLDGVVRESLWKYGLDFRHGTGHGVGYMLSVHEGPNRISFKDTASNIIPGMVTSDEPGIYVDGKYGIRMENLILCVEAQETEYGKFCKFEPLTLCPIDLDGIDTDILNAEDVININKYNKLVFDTLSPHLDDNDVKYLKSVTREI